MKIVLSAIVLLIAFAFGAQEKSAPTEYYYFCDSRPVAKASAKQLILFTPVKKVVCEPDGLDLLTSAWHNRVQELRQGMAAGTADLNSYPRQGFADSVFQALKDSYSDTTKYTVRVILP
jgi:uncharacterized membrane protein YcjF (UPF0283 family)